MISPGKLRKAMRDIAEEKGEFTLFGIFMRTDAPGTWDLVVAAPWLEQGKLKALTELTQLLSRALGEKSLQQFSRVVTLSQDNPGLHAILSSVAVDDGEVRVQKSSLFGLDIEDGIIFRAKRAA
jgi:hypothetical protein